MEEQDSLLYELGVHADTNKMDHLTHEWLAQYAQWVSRYCWSAIYLYFVHLLFGTLFLALVMPDKAHTLSIFPQLRSLRHVISTTHVTSHALHSKYSGPPTDETNRTWQELLQPLFFNASTDDIMSAGLLQDAPVEYNGGGYIASLGVYHDIHCLNKLREYLYRDSYFPTTSDHTMSLVREHLDHCIDMLRTSAMCSPDLSLYAFHWPAKPSANFQDATSNSPRRCVDWNQLSEWSHKRKVELRPTLLKPS